jgi:hypothetical protein
MINCPQVMSGTPYGTDNENESDFYRYSGSTLVLDKPVSAPVIIIGTMKHPLAISKDIGPCGNFGWLGMLQRLQGFG